MNAAEFVSRLGPDAKAKTEGKGWKVCCPAHDDRSPSLSVTDGTDGRVLLTCRSRNCSFQSIVDAAGLKVSDLMPPSTKRNGARRIVATYSYHDEASALLFEVVRFDPKDFRQRHKDASGEWVWKMDGVRRVPYRLPELLKAVKAGLPVFICEGCKDCDAMHKAGLCATCNPGGAGKWLDSFAEFFPGAQVVVIADRDVAGRKHAQDVASKLHGKVASVRVLELPDVDTKPVKDAHDYLAAGRTGADLLELANAAPLWLPTSPTEIASVEPTGAETPGLPEIDDAFALTEHPLITPPALVEGLIRKGEKVVIGGASKSFKSWLALALALCIAHGLTWLGRNVTKGRVLFVNLELPRWCIRKRILDIARRLNITICPDNLLVWTLRGHSVTAELLLAELQRLNPGNLDLIVIDPAYKLLNGRDENSAGDVGGLLNIFERIIHVTGATVAVPTHFAKGNASGKESIDRISGSGVFARDPDSILTMTRHEAEDAFTIEATLRTFPPVAPFVVQWEHPVFTVAESLDPDKLKQARRPGPAKKHDPDSVLKLLPDAGLTLLEWRKVCEQKKGIPRTTFYRLAGELEETGQVLTGSDEIVRHSRIAQGGSNAD